MERVSMTVIIEPQDQARVSVEMTAPPASIEVLTGVLDPSAKINVSVQFSCEENRRFFEAVGVSRDVTEKMAHCASTTSGCTDAYATCVKNATKKK